MKRPGPPVLLVHGIMDSADGWTVNDDQSQAFVLARAGYDVWMANSRGTKKSKRHI
jgi:pimeloyl-ACP methyl ester carboxylesterase